MSALLYDYVTPLLPSPAVSLFLGLRFRLHFLRMLSLPLVLLHLLPLLSFLLFLRGLLRPRCVWLRLYLWLPVVFLPLRCFRLCLPLFLFLSLCFLLLRLLRLSLLRGPWGLVLLWLYQLLLLRFLWRLGRSSVPLQSPMPPLFLGLRLLLLCLPQLRFCSASTPLASSHAPRVSPLGVPPLRPLGSAPSGAGGPPPAAVFALAPEDPFDPSFLDSSSRDPEVPLPPTVPDSVCAEIRKMYVYVVDLFPQAAGSLQMLFFLVPCLKSSSPLPRLRTNRSFSRGSRGCVLLLRMRILVWCPCWRPVGPSLAGSRLVQLSMWSGGTLRLVRQFR